jgi:voltage-gated potassium channel
MQHVRPTDEANAVAAGQPVTTERPAYQMFILAVSVAAIALMVVTATTRPDTETTRLLEWADHTICVLFLADFVACLIRAPNRLNCVVTWGWLDLLASIPAIEVTRWGRLARVFRILRVLRAARATRVIAEVVLRHRTQNALLAVLLVLTVVLFSGSIAALHFEAAHEDGNIRTAGDALWWAITTVTTVGYGDFYPVTFEGRVVAVVLMVTGVGTFATLAGALASWFTEPRRRG